ncbi:MAG: DNA repair protein RadC [Hungatella sp.]
MDKIMMRNIPSNERPYERCQQMGAEVLSDAELLSIIIRTGCQDENSLSVAEKVLSLNYPSDGIVGLLHLTLPELMQVKGIGKVKGIQLLCIGELSRRIWKKEVAHKIAVFENPETIVNYFMEDMRHMEQEQLHVMLLNTKNALIKAILISKGTVNASIASPREIFIEALRYRAVNIILVHNHPSGDPTPSKEDCHLTKQVQEAGSLIGIQLLDHIIIGDNSYSSFRKEGML